MNLPPHRIETCISDRREPGTMMFNVRPGGAADKRGHLGWVCGVDQDGSFTLSMEFGKASQDVRRCPNGNILISLTDDGTILEIDTKGDVKRQWHAAGKWRNRTPEPGSIEIGIELFHHTINFFPNGNFLMLTVEMREYDDWPLDDSDPNAPKHRAKVIGDVILEVAPDGEILNKWRLLDLLDPYRLCYGSCAGYWHARGFPESNDWCHVNAVAFDPSDNSIVASLRTQDCIVKIDCASGDLKWILGDPGNWRDPWADMLLTPSNEFGWQYHQHDCSVLANGNFLCFDNGNFRATPFSETVPPEDNHSRVVEYSVDEETMTVEQVWAFDNGPEDRVFACYQGGAYRLPKTGNTFMTFGGICTADGKWTDDLDIAFARARYLEVTPEKEVVFDMWIDGSDESEPMSLSSFRSEFFSVD